VHQILIPMNGTYILENMNTGPLATDKAYEFLFVLGVPRITGAVQGILTPSPSADGTPRPAHRLGMDEWATKR
jgi:hypothetical protein